MNYYQILGVSYSASFSEIKEAYRKKVKEFHPDKESGNAELFKKLKESYEILKNAEKRKRYDEQLFQTTNPISNRSQQFDPSKINPTITSIHIGRKNEKRISLPSLAFHSAIVLLGMMGNAYLKNRKGK